MPAFSYQALSKAGHTKAGAIEAGSAIEAVAQLQKMGLRPLSLVEDGKKATPEAVQGKPLPLALKLQFMKQLATLLQAGVTLDRALQIMAAEKGKPSYQALLHKLHGNVAAGKSFSAALQATGAFLPDETGLVAAGEQSGALPQLLSEMATTLARQHEVRSKMVSALIYPAFLLALAPLALIVIAVVLVPNIEPLFDNPDAKIPLLLRFMMGLSHSFANYGYVWLAALAVAVLVTGSILADGWRRAKLQSVLFRLPVLRTIQKRSETARMCQTLSALLHSGASLQAALETTAGVVKNSTSRAGILQVRQKISNGEKLSHALQHVPNLTDAMRQMIAIGEETNRLETMLHYVGDMEEKSLAQYVDRLMTLLTPLLTVLVGVMIGGLVMSIMRAILSINDLVLQ